MRSAALALLLSLAILVGATRADAEVAPSSGSESAEDDVLAGGAVLRGSSRGSWYGWQTLLTDAAWLGGGPSLGLAVPANARVFVALGGAATYVFAPAVIHLVHHRGQAALASLALRLGGPAALGGIGMLTGFLLGFGRTSPITSTPWSGAASGLFFGTASGVVMAITLDASLFAFERRFP
jgi:hypothetical protein